MINFVFFFVLVDLIKFWFNNGKNMLFFEVDFWIEVINLKIDIKVLKDKCVWKGCFVVLNCMILYRF